VGGARPIQAVYNTQHYTAEHTSNLYQRRSLEHTVYISTIPHTIKCTRELGSRTWFPVKFNKEHVCWVEVCLIEPAGSESYWQAFRIAGEDLGLDITQGDVEFHIQGSALTNY
jgi:hypothetical protein